MPRLTASILVLFLICFSTGCGQSKNTATASLRLIPPPGAIGPEGEFASLDSYYQTQIDLLCSDVILTEACADLKESQKTQQANSSDYRDRAADWQSRLSVTRNKDSQILK
nr:hypothetical protein [Pirellula sp.]